MRKMFAQNAAPEITEEQIDAVLNNIDKYKNSTIVLKFGGEMIADEQMLEDILRQSIKLKRHGCNVILIHGGGTQITDDLKAQGIADGKDPITGLRMCDEQIAEISHSTLSRLNRQVVRKLNEIAKRLDLDIVGMGEGGYNGGLVRAEPMHAQTRTGNFVSADAEALNAFANLNKIPILYPICMGPDSEILNVNADLVAAGIARATGAKSLIMVTDVPGVWDKNKNPIQELTINEVQALIEDGTISGGMIAKVLAAIEVAKMGINVVITTPKDGGLFRELFTVKGSGTMILAPKREDNLPPPFNPNRYAMA